MKKIFNNTLIRWIAVFIFLIAYILVSQGIVDGRGLIYNLLSISGSVLMIVTSLRMKPKDWSVVVFNMVWVGIGLYTVSRLLF